MSPVCCEAFFKSSRITASNIPEVSHKVENFRVRFQIKQLMADKSFYGTPTENVNALQIQYYLQYCTILNHLTSKEAKLYFIIFNYSSIQQKAMYAILHHVQ